MVHTALASDLHGAVALEFFSWYLKWLLVCISTRLVGMEVGTLGMVLNQLLVGDPQSFQGSNSW